MVASWVNGDGGGRRLVGFAEFSVFHRGRERERDN